MDLLKDLKNEWKAFTTDSNSMYNRGKDFFSGHGGANTANSNIGDALIGSIPIFGQMWTAQKQNQANDYNLHEMQRTQEETWRREDTARTRAVEDLRNAGLSPTLAAGSPAATASTSAPHSSIVENKAPEEMMEVAKLALGIYMGNANVAKTLAQTSLIAQQEANAMTQGDILENLVKKSKYEADYSEANAELQGMEVASYEALNKLLASKSFSGESDQSRSTMQILAKLIPAFFQMMKRK